MNCSCTHCSTASHAYTLLHFCITFTDQKHSPGTHRHTSGSSLDGWGGGADCRRSRPGEGAGRGHPSHPAKGYGGALGAPPLGFGAPSQKPALFALENPPKLLKNCNGSIITNPAFIFSMRRTTVHSFRKYDNDDKIHYTDTADTDGSLLSNYTDRRRLRRAQTRKVVEQRLGLSVYFEFSLFRWSCHALCHR